MFGPDVAVADPLEVLGRAERDGPAAVGEREQRDLVALEQLLDHDIAPERLHRAQRVGRAASSVWQTKTPLPEARPSAFTTHGARATGSVAAIGTPAVRSTSFAKVFEPSMRAAAALGPKTVMPLWRSSSATPATSGAFGPDHDEVGRRASPQDRAGLLRLLLARDGTCPAMRCRDCRARRATRSDVGSARDATRGRARALLNRRRAPSRRRVL